MPFASYSALKTGLTEILARDDLATPASVFVGLAEQYLKRENRTRIREAEAKTTLVSDAAGVCTLPADFAAVRDIYPESETSTVERFEVIGQTIQLDPIAEGESIVLNYYRSPTGAASLSDSNQTNWLLDAAPHVYFYASLIHSAPYIGNDDRMSTWGTLLETALEQLRSSDRLARYSRAVAYVSGPTP